MSFFKDAFKGSIEKAFTWGGRALGTTIGGPAGGEIGARIGGGFGKKVAGTEVFGPTEFKPIDTSVSTPSLGQYRTTETYRSGTARSPEQAAVVNPDELNAAIQRDLEEFLAEEARYRAHKTV